MNLMPRLTPFEQGYLACKQGVPEDGNPHDFDEQPYSHRQWKLGWHACRRRMQEVMR